jgi:adenylosuccinate lyase
MIARYMTPEMRALWTEERKFQTWLQVEQAIANAQAELGIIPRAAARQIARARFDTRQIERFEAETRHDVIAFLKSVEASIPGKVQYLHFGLTSYDIVDTALALRVREAVDLILAEAKSLLAALRKLALQHKNTPMMGRTHGVHAEPITFGLKVLSWHQELKRSIARLELARQNVSFGKVSGAVGSFSQLSPRVEVLALKSLGLKPEPVATQVVPRDRLAELLLTAALCGAGLERIALEIRNLQRTEIAEVAESFAKGQRGSSAMPHKKNPITCERISGLARILRGNVIVALENIPLWHERDLSNSSAERIIIPDSLALLHYLLRQMLKVIGNLQVNAMQMLENLEGAHGQYCSQRLMLELVKAGMPKDDAYQLVQSLSFTAQERSCELAGVAAQNRKVCRYLDKTRLAQVFDLRSLLRNTDYIFRRALK